MLKIYLNGKSENCIFTLCIGKEYVERWERISLPFWKIYCERHDLSLIALISPFKDTGGKRVDWQKLLCGKAVRDSKLKIQNVCFVDYDIVPNPYAPNIFETYNENSIGFVSQRENMPYKNVNEVLKLIAYYRNKYSDGGYPLDSYLFASPQKIFEDHGLPPYNNYGCGGLFILNVESHSKLFENSFEDDERHALDVSNPGEEAALNHCIQGSGKCHWLDYSWQTLWWYEMPWNYPWLYDRERRTSTMTQDAILSTLMKTNFLHFVGSWEKWAWEEAEGLFNKSVLHELEKFSLYKKEMPKSPNLGLIFPKSSDELKLVSQ